MHNRTTLKRHAYLVDEMAKVQSVDLEEQILRGALSVSELEDAVLRCIGCSQPCACEGWLATQQAPAAAPPSYCRNTELFADLKKAAQ
ncbi:DUF6455 family protein [Primorskyibacter sp. 2E107]|uniref:DUF6455 family protein n=1 Tax=Primorskyibacter sp. 2E107 TaxID=3403458 RepID=UPI003AF93480